MKKEIDSFIESLRHRPRARTEYPRVIKQFFAITGRAEIGEVTEKDVTKWYDHILHKYADATIAFHIIAFKRFAVFWARRKKLRFFPDEIEMHRYESRPYYALKKGEWERMNSLLSESEFYRLQIKVIHHLLWYSALRVSELVNLNISQLDTKILGAKITAAKTGQRQGRQHWIYWPEETHRLLLKFLGVRICLNSQPWLFVSSREGHKRISRRSVERWVRIIAKEADIKEHVVPHSYRHGITHHSHSNLGADIADLQEILRHSKKNPVSIIHYLQRTEREAEPRIRKLFKRDKRLIHKT